MLVSTISLGSQLLSVFEKMEKINFLKFSDISKPNFLHLGAPRGKGGRLEKFFVCKKGIGGEYLCANLVENGQGVCPQ